MSSSFLAFRKGYELCLKQCSDAIEKKGFISSEIKYLFPSFPTLIALSLPLEFELLGGERKDKIEPF